MLKVYGAQLSSPFRAVLSLIKIENDKINDEVKIIFMNMAKKEHKTEEFLKINPNGKVPVL